MATCMRQGIAGIAQTCHRAWTMNWQTLRVANCGTHHIDQLDRPAYQQLFDEVLKFHAPGLAPVRRNDSAWHVWSDGEAVYTRRFLRTFGFYDDRATVVGAGGWHHITTDGEDAYKARYTWCGNSRGVVRFEVTITTTTTLRLTVRQFTPVIGVTLATIEMALQWCRQRMAVQHTFDSTAALCTVCGTPISTCSTRALPEHVTKTAGCT